MKMQTRHKGFYGKEWVTHNRKKQKFIIAKVHQYIGIEVSKEYVDMANERINQEVLFKL